MKYYLAVDIGASSGRLILSHLEEGKMILEEVHRFPNGMDEVDGHLTWDVDRLFSEIIRGMKICKDMGKIPVSIGVDTWAVDYVLLDKDGNRCDLCYGYRDSRTNGMDERVYEIIPEDVLYERTGIQKQPFNTIYQLMATKVQNPKAMEDASTMLMIPDYLHYLLSGIKVTEYTNASTTQLVSPISKDWDWELIDKLGYKRDLFCQICLPGEYIGQLTEEIQEEVGYNCHVVIPASHDTGSAVMAVPTLDDDALYISSGTWSLMGCELQEAICTSQSMTCNFTNEGGFDYRFRYLKNIMGMWMINSVKKEIAPDMSYADICSQASKVDIDSLVDANDPRFLAPKSMTEEVKKACQESNQQVPEGIAEVAAVIYKSLAICYAKTVKEIEAITGKEFEAINIIGGGANADYLNKLTARACNKKILAGPIEATAIGNVMAQMIASAEVKTLQDARRCVYDSFEIKVYK